MYINVSKSIVFVLLPKNIIIIIIMITCKTMIIIIINIYEYIYNLNTNLPQKHARHCDNIF